MGKKTGGRPESIRVRLDGCFDGLGVAAAQRDYDRDIAGTGALEHQSVPLFQPFKRQRKPAEPVGFESIHASLKEYNFRLEVPDFLKGRGQKGEVRTIFRGIGKCDVDGALLFAEREIIAPMHGKRQPPFPPLKGLALENRSRSVPLMNVEIDYGGALYSALSLQRADGNGNVVEDAEPGAFRAKRVVGPAGEPAPYAAD